PEPVPGRSAAPQLRLRAALRGALVRLAARDEDVLEELARAAARAPVDVPSQAGLEREPGALQDRRIEIAAVVDDDQDRGTRRERARDVSQHGGDPVGVRVERAPARPRCGRSELERAEIVEA